MQIKTLYAATLCFLLTQPVHAEIVDDIYNAQLSFGWAPVVTLTVGPTWAATGKKQDIIYHDSLGIKHTSTYYPNREQRLGTSGSIIFSLQNEICPGLTAQLGLETGGVGDFPIDGIVNVDGLGDLYTYSYRVNHLEVGLAGKLIASNVKPVQPYLSASLGVGFNRTHDFRHFIEEVLIPQPYTPWYTNTQATAFTYALGAGIQTTVYKYWQIGVGYQFADLGKNYLGPDNAAFYKNTTGLKTTHVYTQQLQFSLSYLCW